MIKVNNRADKWLKKLDDVFDKITDSDQMRDFGNKSIEIIVNRTRYEGKGVPAQFGNRKTLKKVTEKYSKRRAKMKGKHPDAASGRASNLTLTGEMLDKLMVIKATKREVIIGWKQKKQGEKASGQADQGREFLFLGSAEYKELLKDFEKSLKDELKNI